MKSPMCLPCAKKIHLEKSELTVFDKIPIGRLLPDQQKQAGVKEENAMVYLSSPGTKEHGIKHWRKHNMDTINARDTLRILAMPLWNPNAVITKSVDGGKTRYAIQYRGEKNAISNVLLQYSDIYDTITIDLIDLWYPPTEYLDRLKK